MTYDLFDDVGPQQPTAPAPEWDVWVGPGPEPGTGRRLTAARWSLSVPGPTPAARLKRYLLRLDADPARVERARLDLAGKRLGCSCPEPCFRTALTRVANGETPMDVLGEWLAVGVFAKTREMFEGGDPEKMEQLRRVGKEAAGRLLDGVLHDEVPS